jgi:hypothetical protein
MKLVEKYAAVNFHRLIRSEYPSGHEFHRNVIPIALRRLCYPWFLRNYKHGLWHFIEIALIPALGDGVVVRQRAGSSRRV